jgi:hypothetical protein
MGTGSISLDDEGIVNELPVEEDLVRIVWCDKDCLFMVGVVDGSISASTGVPMAVSFSCLQHRLPKVKMLLRIIMSRPVRIFVIGKFGGRSVAWRSNHHPMDLIP